MLCKLDDCRMATCPPQARVEGQQGDTEGLGQRNVRRVVRRQVTPQLPDSRQQIGMGMPADGKVHEVVEGTGGAVAGEAADPDEPSENLCDFQVNQMRRLQRFPGIEKAVGES